MIRLVEASIPSLSFASVINPLRTPWPKSVDENFVAATLTARSLRLFCGPGVDSSFFRKPGTTLAIRSRDWSESICRLVDAPNRSLSLATVSNLLRSPWPKPVDEDFVAATLTTRSLRFFRGSGDAPSVLRRPGTSLAARSCHWSGSDPRHDVAFFFSVPTSEPRRAAVSRLVGGAFLTTNFCRTSRAILELTLSSLLVVVRPLSESAGLFTRLG